MSMRSQVKEMSCELNVRSVGFATWHLPVREVADSGPYTYDKFGAQDDVYVVFGPGFHVQFSKFSIWQKHRPFKASSCILVMST